MQRVGHLNMAFPFFFVCFTGCKEALRKPVKVNMGIKIGQGRAVILQSRVIRMQDVHIFKDISFLMCFCVRWVGVYMHVCGWVGRCVQMCVCSSGVKIILQNVAVIVKKFHFYII
jgi:hypothetical protein